MRVHWTDSALEQLDQIHSYIARTSPDYARRMVDRLTRRTQQIGEYPLSGRTVREYDLAQVREVIETPYRIIYHIKPDQIDVIAVLHTARGPLSSEGSDG